jgi:hypothetical protein
MHIALTSTARLLVVSLACLIVLVLSACQSSRPSKGKLSGDVYTSPHGNFSMPIPLESGLGRRIEDDATDPPGEEGHLSVSNDYGTLRTIQWVALPDAARAALEAAPLDRLRDLYRDGVVGLIANKIPGTRSLHDESMPDASAPAHFGVVFIPNGSTLVKGNVLGLSTGERLDTVRAYMAFAQDGYAYILGCATNADAMQADTTMTPERLDKYKLTLGKMRSSMRFPAAP